MWLFSQERAVYIIWVRFVCTRRSRGYTNLTNIIYTALSRLNNHIISKERMKLLVMYIFLFALNYGVPIHPTRYNFTSAYILCHICCILITCLYYIRNRFTDASSYARIYLTTNWNHKRNERRENVKRIYKWEYYIIICNVLCLFCKNEPPVLGPEVCYILNRSTKYFFREYIEVRKKVLPWFEANKITLKGL